MAVGKHMVFEQKQQNKDSLFVSKNGLNNGVDTPECTNTSWKLLAELILNTHKTEFR